MNFIWGRLCGPFQNLISVWKCRNWYNKRDLLWYGL